VDGEPVQRFSQPQIRYWLRVVIRIIALGLFVHAAIRLLGWIEGAMYTDWASLGSLNAIVWLLLLWLPYPAAAVSLLILERRLALWLVPPIPRHRCPACDYDTRYATGGRCPECGLQLEQQ
jgi:hypothetical protein